MPSILPPVHHPCMGDPGVVGTVTSNERECIDQPVGNVGKNYVRCGMQRIKGLYE